MVLSRQLGVTPRVWVPALMCALVSLALQRDQPVQPITAGMTITQPGHYVLEYSVVTPALRGVTIATSDVTLDLSQRTLQCAAPSPETTTNVGIFIHQVTNVLVTNGAIQGCYIGIQTVSTQGLRVQNVHFRRIRYIGANLLGKAFTLVNNAFTSISGHSTEAYAVGINVHGKRVTIDNNRFAELYRQPSAKPELAGEGVGIIIGAESEEVSIRNNTFENTRIEKGAIGIWVSSANRVIVGQNRFTDFPYGIVLDRTQGAPTISGNCLQMRRHYRNSQGITGNTGYAVGNRLEGFAVPIYGDIGKRRNTIQSSPAVSTDCRT